MSPQNQPWFIEAQHLRFFATGRLLFVADFAGLDESRRCSWRQFLEKAYPSRRVVFL